jgi:NAD(P)H-hydrate epimerase
VNFPPVLTAAQMRQFDGDASRATALPSLILMENAGRGVADVLRVRCPGPRIVCVLCGAGNNGGDGFVVARHLAAESHRSGGYDIRVLLATARSKLAGDAAAMLRALAGLPGVSVVEQATASKDDWSRSLAEADVVVDALLGTGLREEVRGTIAAAIAAVNECAALKIAVDIPSGADAETGLPHGLAVRADVTVTMGARKLGLVLDPNVGMGEIEVVSLGVPVVIPVSAGPGAFWVDEGGVRALLPARRGSSYKGDGGHLLVVAGSAGKSGAAWLTARAALRAGAGLVTVASTAAGQVALDAKVVEEMTARYADEGDDADAGSFAAIEKLLARPHLRAAALGPGIPTGPGMCALVERMVTEVAVPMVVDADGLNLMGGEGAPLLAGAKAPRVVTPHPGEMARLVGRSSTEVQGDRVGIARAFAERSKAVVVLKGARTLVAAPTGEVFVNPAVEPALGTAGSGDVLTGVIGALLTQGLPPLEAAVAAVFLHGRAGAVVGRARGAPGAIAGDLPDAIATVRATLSAPR